MNVFDCVVDRGCRVINYCFPGWPPNTVPTFLIDTYTWAEESGAGPSIQEGWQPLPLAGQLTVAAILRAQPRPRTCLAVASL